ncbi:b73.5 [Murid betaherpesvirus 8]|uniref:B73.5 n=1 Tax=Rat cytomegalovirus (isolate England) TaxID=1261657 RepID=K7YNN3_RCMVE|nr:e73.5 [Murid betaherpesvirus 8]AFX83387.1 e73.5 [Murid betaherpesvirus 8]AKB93268.1 b73.5 [Murid betaherpesvirus 8]WPH24983.1 b73.5 [Murid betaherpesvirus 8]WPH25116.1 b73.5 [Murid betaherpesvirus 8]
MSTEKLTGYADKERGGRSGTGTCSLCYAIAWNIVLMFLVILLMYRAVIGFQDDIVQRSSDVFRKVFTGNRVNVTGSS